MNRRDDEALRRLLDDGGGEFGALYRRLRRVEPPRRLDRSVLAEAARAVHGTQRPRRQRWLFAGGSLAGIVLAAGIAWRVGQEHWNAPPRGSAPAPTRPHVIPIDTIALPPASVAEPPVPSPPPSPATAESAPPAAAPVRKATAMPRAATPSAASATETMREMPKPIPAPAAIPAPTEPEAAAPATTDAEPERAADASGYSGGTSADTAQPRAETAARDARRAAAPLASPSSSAQLRRNLQLAPQDWLAEIQRLQREGQRQQAIENLRLFQRAHPDWQLPDSLRTLVD